VGEKENDSLATEEQVDVVMQFANGLNQFFRTGTWTPYTQNVNLLSLNNSPVKATYKDLVDALSKSLSNAKDIQGYSEFMAVFDTIYSKTINYYKSILAFDLTWDCVNAKKEDYQTKEYEEDVRRLRKFLTNFDYKREFNEKVIPALVNTGIFYGWFRDSSGTINDNPLDDDDVTIKRKSKYSLQIMPQDRCKLTGYWENGLLYDFDMSYFLNPTVDIRLYDPSFIKKSKEVIDKSSIKGLQYVPSSQLDSRNGTYALWTQTSPKDGAVVFKFNEGNFNIIPPFANLMKPTFNNTNIHKLQMDKNIASAWAILYGNIGLLDKEKSGQKPNQTAFTPEALSKFMELVQGALQSIMKTVALPLEDTRFGQFKDSNADMETNALQTSAGQGAYGSSLIYNTNTTNQSVVLNGVIADYNIMRKLYPQFASMLGYYANKKTKKFKFEFEFDGSNFPFEREYRRKAINELASVGITLPSQYWASAYGYKPHMFQRALEEAHYGNFQDVLTPLANMYQTNGAQTRESENGRPKKDVTEQSDSASRSQDYN
jgi:hypothetical protein